MFDGVVGNAIMLPLWPTLTSFSTAFDVVALASAVAVDCHSERVVSDWMQPSDRINTGR